MMIRLLLFSPSLFSLCKARGRDPYMQPSEEKEKKGDGAIGLELKPGG